MHNGLATLLAKSALKVLAVVCREVVAGNWLSAILVYSLRNLVASGVTETGKEGEELGARGGSGLVLEDDRVELGTVGDLQVEGVSGALDMNTQWRVCKPYLGLVAHQALGNRVDLGRICPLALMVQLSSTS